MENSLAISPAMGISIGTSFSGCDTHFYVGLQGVDIGFKTIENTNSDYSASYMPMSVTLPILKLIMEQALPTLRAKSI